MISNKIINYRDLISKSTQGFVGRGWVRDAVDDFLNADRPRYFLLMGEPGSGKTSFMADLVQRRGYPHHFIGKGSQIGLAASLDWRNPVRFAESMGYQLLRDYGGWIMRWDDWGIHVSQDVKELEGLLTGAQVRRFTATPRLAHRPKLTVEQEVARLGPAAHVVGVYIDKFVMEIEQVVRELLTLPLQNIAQRWPEHQVVLVVDGLDEAEGYSDPQRNILNLLPDGSLPANVRLLLSSRPGEHLTQGFLSQVRPFWLSEDEQGHQDPRTIEDAKGYVAALTAEEPVKQILSERKVQVQALSERVAETSQGNFLYLHHYAQGVRDGDATLLNLETLPKGLYGIYADLLGTIKGQREDVSWDGAYKPLLATLAVAREPLTRQQLSGFCGVNQGTTATILMGLKSFLDIAGEGRDRRYAIYHKSFGEYLVSEENEDYIDGAEANAHVVAHYRQGVTSWVEIGWDKVDVYGLRHLPVHLAEAGHHNELRELLLDFGWLQAKLEATTVNALLADYELLGDDAALELIRGALRLSAHVLAQEKTQLAGQLYGRLLSNKDPDIQTMLEQARQQQTMPWLRPLAACLDKPGGLLVCTFTDHAAFVKRVEITPDGRYAVSASADETVRIWDLASRESLHCLRHDKGVQMVAISGDGQRVVSSSMDSTLKVWDLVSGRCLHTLRGHEKGIDALAITPDGQGAVSGSHDGTLALWNLATGELLHTVAAHDDTVSAVAMTLSGEWAVSASWDHKLKVWDVATGELLHTLAGHADAVWAVAITPDGRHAVSVSDDCEVKVWDLATGELLHTLAGHSAKVWAVAITPDGRHAISGAFDGTLIVWDLTKGRQVQPLRGHTGAIRALAITSDGSRVVSASGDRTLKVWDLDSYRNLATLQGHMGSVEAVAVSTDGLQAVSACYNGTLKVWNLAATAAHRKARGHTSSVNAVAITPDAQRAITASSDGMLKVWNLDTAQEMHTLACGEFCAEVLAITPDGQHAVSASTKLRLWHLDSGREILALKGHSDSVKALAVTPDGRYVVSVSKDGTVRVGNLCTGEETRVLMGKATYVSDVAITPDGQHVVLAATHGNLEVLHPFADLQAGPPIACPEGCTEVAVTPDGQCAISADEFGGTLTVWDITSGQMVHPLAGHKGDRVWKVRVTVTPDGRQAVSASEDGTLMVWDLATGDLVHTLTGHTRTVFQIAFTPDGRRAVTVSSDWTLRVWDLTRGICLATFHAESSLETCAMASDGVTIVAGDDLGGVHCLRLERPD